MMSASELANVVSNPLSASDAPGPYSARVHLVAFSEYRSRVAVEFVPPIPSGSQVRWSLTYRWPRVWDSARLPADGLFSRGFLGFGDADDGAVTIVSPPRSIKGPETFPNANGGCSQSLTWTVNVARIYAGISSERARF